MSPRFALCALLVLSAGGCKKTFVSSANDDSPPPAMIADVHDDGPPKVTGSPGLVEVRGAATTPWKRAAAGIDAAKTKGATSFVLVAGDRKTRPITLPRAATGGMMMEINQITIQQDGKVAVNGAPIAGKVDVARAVMLDATSRHIIVVGHASVEMAKVVEIIHEVEGLGRPLSIGLEM